LQAILFDLDGTLLDLDLDQFMFDYMRALGEHSHTLYPSQDMAPALLESTKAMAAPHPGTTNQQTFNERFMELTGVDLDSHWPLFREFYDGPFDDLGRDARSHDGAREAVDTARRLGLQVVVATNPMFPAIAVEKRLGWAGFSSCEFDLITTYESMHACKPLAAYYLEISTLIGVPSDDCMMVGDDPVLDMSAADVGMKTYFVGNAEEVVSDYVGDLSGLAGLLPRFL